jgi:hypothetical protein
VSQTLELQRHLAKGHKITPLQALRKFGVLRLSARMADLRRDGWPVKARTVSLGQGKRVAEYSFDRSRRRK